MTAVLACGFVGVAAPPAFADCGFHWEGQFPVDTDCTTPYGLYCTIWVDEPVIGETCVTVVPVE